MKTDSLFYRLFETSPETFFLVLGMSADSARDMAARYQYEAIEFKETAHRVDGVFLPKEPGLPLYVCEVQFYWKPFSPICLPRFTPISSNTIPANLFAELSCSPIAIWSLRNSRRISLSWTPG